MGTIIQIVATSSGGTENGLAAIDVPLAGNIMGVSWACQANLDTDDDFLLWQLSFGSTISVANDSRQVISNVNMGSLTFTAGGSVVGQANYYHPIPEVPVGMGERLYLHSTSATGVISVARVLLSFDFDLDKVQVRRR